jgi:PST family polysaccharide transporter
VKKPGAVLRYGGFFASVSAARIGGMLLTSVTFPILVRRLGVEAYGLWSYVIALVTFFEVIANPGLTTYTGQQVAARRHQAADLLPDFLALHAMASAAAVMLLLIVASFDRRAEVRHLLQWYGAGAMILGLLGSDFLLTSLELFHVRSALALAQQALYAVGVLSLVHSPKDVVWVPASILGSSLLTNLLGWVVLWRNGFRLAQPPDPRRWRGILVPSLHYAATTMMATVYHRSGHILVRWLLGDYALGLYAAAVRFVDLLRNLATMGFNILTPRMALSGQSPAQLKRLVRAAVSSLAAVSIPLTLGTLATAQLVVPLILGKSFVPAVGPVRWIAPFLLAAPVASLLSGTILYALGRYRAYLISAAAGAIVAVVCGLLLTRVFGLPGACLAFVFGELAVAIAAGWQIPRELREEWKNPFIAVATVAALLMVAGVLLVNRYTARPLLVVASGAASYGIAAAVLGRKILTEQFGSANAGPSQ